MFPRVPFTRATAWALPVCALVLAAAGCNTMAQNVGLTTVGATVLGARTPAHEIEQICYLGVFDPQEQVPPMVYRVRVRGQASFISRMRFASGWVQASVIDSLGTHIGFDEETGRIKIEKDGEGDLAKLQTGRRLIVFGPEGFREVPKDYRFVVVMGASPEEYFSAVDQSLGLVSKVMAEQRQEGLNKLILEALTRAKTERDNLERVAKDIETDVVQPKGDDQ